MIEKLNPLPKIPYVDGVPSDSTQKQIQWIRNGETLEGAESKTSNEGNLNQAGVSIQKNTVQLEANTDIHNQKINEVIDQLNVITENLEAVADESVINTLNDAVADIAQMQTEVTQIGSSVSTQTQKINGIIDEIGVYDSTTDPKHRTLRKDIIFLKNELGAYAGFNVNGDVDPTSTGTGLKYRVMQNALATSIQEGRLTKLEDEWALSDVGQLTQELIDLRNEIGPKGLATLQPVYVRLNDINTRFEATNSEIAVINNYIGRTGSGSSGSIVTRVSTAENEINALKISMYDPSGVINRVSAIETTIGTSTTPGGVKYDIAQTKRTLMDINMVLGEAGDEGLRGEFATVLTDIGSDSEPLSMKGRILNLEDTTRDTTSRLIDVESRVGNTSSGLVAANIVIGKDLYGDATSSDIFTKDGIKKTLKDTLTAIGSNEVGAQTGIYKLISDLTARVLVLESDNANLKQEILLKANTSQLTDYYTKVESDAKFQPKAV